MSSSSALDSLHDPPLRIEVSEGDVVRMIWKGKSLPRRPQERLAPFLDGLLEKAALRVQGVEMDVRELAFMSAATMGVVVWFMGRAAVLAVPVTVFYDDSVKWQKMHFSAMCFLESSDPPIRMVPGPPLSKGPAEDEGR